MQNRITPNSILELKDNEIFVFGSNTQGIHAGGAARLAYEKFGAKWGIGSGITGRCYAIPTIEFNHNIEGKHINLLPSVREIDKFIKCSIKYSDLIFLVTEIGCGIAGFSPEEIAPLFKDAMSINNIYLPEKFWKVLNKK